jgi:hypothetical protein
MIPFFMVPASCFALILLVFALGYLFLVLPSLHVGLVSKRSPLVAVQYHAHRSGMVSVVLSAHGFFKRPLARKEDLARAWLRILDRESVHTHEAEPCAIQPTHFSF